MNKEYSKHYFSVNDDRVTVHNIFVIVGVFVNFFTVFMIKPTAFNTLK